MSNAQASAAPTSHDKPGAGLGSFAGVFTPSVLTILGIILFLRLGYVVGNVGLWHAMLIMAAAHSISILTSLSLSAIATNLRVKGGGDYYLISRTLGLGFGGAIGIVLFLAQSVAIGFYCIGFAEAITSLLPATPAWVLQAIAAVAVLGMFCLAWMGADWASRFQFGVMFLLCAALLSFATGALPAWSESQLLNNWAKPEGALPFWIAFAIFFPAVTGFTQGVSMSGDLRDAGRSIPLGTLAAVLVSMLVYFGMALMFAGAAPLQALAADGMAMKRLSITPFLFDFGVIAATLSSALASFMGAPRILQAMGQDEVLRPLKWFAHGSGGANNPRRAVALSCAIALLVVASGNLNTVAAIVSMFFLLSYALLNYATYYEARSASPSFRPTFRYFNQNASLLGAAICVGVMFAIDTASALVAGALVFVVLRYLRRRAEETRWADGRRSYHLQQVRNNLLAAAAEPEHARDWRPQILVFSDDSTRRARILKFASWVEGGAGVITAVRVIEGQGPEVLRQRADALEELREELEAHESSAFPLVVSGRRLDDTISAVVQSAGVGPVRANTVIVNWIKKSALLGHFGAERFSRNLRESFRFGCNLLLLDADDAEWGRLDQVPSKKRRVDIWWTDSVTGELMLLLAHLMKRATEWEAATLRVLALQSARESVRLREEMEARLSDIRIDAELIIVPGKEVGALVEASKDASLVFVPFGIYAGRFYHAWGGDIGDLLPSLPIVVMALAAQDVDLEADPDEVEAKDAGETEAPEAPAEDA